MTIRQIISSSQEQYKRGEGYLFEESLPLFTDGVSAGDVDVEMSLFKDVEYQKLIGFGGAFTESAAYNVSRASDEHRQEILQAYFGEGGLSYSLCRTHIQSCDFALDSYAYVEDSHDVMSSFSIERDKKYLIPFIQAAKKISQTPITLVASPWSPPAFMKTNNTMCHGGSLLPEHAQSWAEVLVRYLLSYKELGIDVWGITVQNEPEATQTWDSCLYSASEEGDFILNHLVPALTRAQLDPHIIVWDHNRDQLFKRACIIYEHPAAQYIWGSGFHWYEEVFLGRALHEEVAKTHEHYPSKHLIMTEACQELMNQDVEMGDWSVGERYARNIIGDLNAWCEGWIDWNMVLDEKGGPNHVGNLCDAPIKIDHGNQKLVYANSYYYIGHFSKFIAPRAVRIQHTLSNNSILATSWKLGEEIILVLLNVNDEEKTVMIKSNETQYYICMEAHSIKTIIGGIL